MSHLRIALVSYLLVVACANQGLAADLNLQLESKLCQLHITGEILPHDAKRVDELLTNNEKKIASSGGLGKRVYAICLNSQGGNFAAGIELAKIINKHSKTTIIPAKARCVSACAIAFMGGRISDEPGTTPSRRLHVAGTLGFHAPYVTNEEAKASTGIAVKDLYTATVGSIGELIAIANQLKFDMGLLAEMLQRSPREMYLIDRVERVGRWNIELFGYGEDQPIRSQHLNRQNLSNICESGFLWHNNINHLGETECFECYQQQKSYFRYRRVARSVSRLQTFYFFIGETWGSGRWGGECVLEASFSGGQLFGISFGKQFITEYKRGALFANGLPLFMLAPRETNIRSLKAYFVKLRR